MKLLIQATASLLLSLMSHAGYLGLGLEITKDGAVVKELVKGGPSAKAGLRNGDLLVEIDGRQAEEKDMPEIVHGIAAAPEGTPLKVTYQRNGKRQAAEIILGKRPAPPRPVVQPEEAPAKPRPRNKWHSKKLPELKPIEWYQLPAGKTSLESDDFNGKVLVLFFFTGGDSEEHAAGMKSLSTIALTLRGNEQVMPIAIHIPGKDPRTQSAKAGLRELRKFGLHAVPMAQVVPGAAGKPILTEELDIPELPYFMIVDSGGVVRLAEPDYPTILLIMSLEQLDIFGVPSSGDRKNSGPAE